MHLLFRLHLLLGVLFTLIVPSASGNAQNKFLNPSLDTFQSWTVGTQQTVSWKTTWQQGLNITLWQQHPTQQSAQNAGIIFSTIPGNEPTTSFIWTVQTYSLKIEHSRLFFFWFNHGDLGGFISGFLNISSSIPTTSTTLTASSTTSSSSSSTTVSTTTPATTLTSMSTTTSAGTEPPRLASTPGSKMVPERSSLTSAEQIGLGLGVGIGGLLLVLAGSSIAWCIAKQKNQSMQPIPPIQPLEQILDRATEKEDIHVSPLKSRRHPGPFELHNSSYDPVQELPADDR